MERVRERERKRENETERERERERWTLKYGSSMAPFQREQKKSVCTVQVCSLHIKSCRSRDEIRKHLKQGKLAIVGCFI